MSHHATALRNREPIASKLAEVIDDSKKLRALEFSSGTGAHVEHFAPKFPNVTWQPTEYVVDDGESRNATQSSSCVPMLAICVSFEFLICSSDEPRDDEERFRKYGKIGDRAKMKELEVDNTAPSHFEPDTS